MPSIQILFLLLFGKVYCRKIESFSVLDEIESDEDILERAARQPTQYVSEIVRNQTYSKVKNEAFSIFTIRNFRTFHQNPPEMNVQVSTRGNESFVLEFVKHAITDFSSKKIEVYKDLAIIQNLSLPFKFNNVEYYFGTNWDVSNYSSIPHPLICEYPMARYSPTLYGRFYSMMPAHRVSRIFFGCESTRYTYCCGMECCENIEIGEIMKTFLYFFGVLIFLILVCQQISSCDKRAERKRRIEDFVKSLN